MRLATPTVLLNTYVPSKNFSCIPPIYHFESEISYPEAMRHASTVDGVGICLKPPNIEVTSLEKNEHVCWKCQAALSPSILKEVTYLENHHQNGLQSTRNIEVPGSVQSTARAGCPLCRRFINYLPLADRDLLRCWAEEECRTKYEYSVSSGTYNHASVKLTTFLALPGLGDSEAPLFVESCVELQPASGKKKNLLTIFLD